MIRSEDIIGGEWNENLCERFEGKFNIFMFHLFYRGELFDEMGILWIDGARSDGGLV